MATKSLVLGAHPPFKGPLVSLEGSDAWEVIVVGDDDSVQIEVEKECDCKKRRLSRVVYGDKVLEGVSIRAHLNTISDIELERSTTVSIESI